MSSRSLCVSEQVVSRSSGFSAPMSQQHSNQTLCEAFPYACHYGSTTGLIIGDYDGMIGTLPTELGFSTVLESIDISHNSLSGTIPTEIANLRALYHIDFGYNLISGASVSGGTWRRAPSNTLASPPPRAQARCRASYRAAHSCSTFWPAGTG